MATISLQYCSAASGKTVDIDYDDVAHTIIAYDPAGANCSPGVVAGTEIYQHTQSGILYSVRVQNTVPYAYVVEIPVVVCSIVIDSVLTGNASTDEAANGSIAINVTSSGRPQYSINDGQTYQFQNTFNNLAPGTYSIRVKTTRNGETCFDTDTVTVGFTTLVCDLELGNVNTTVAPGGTISVVSVNTTKPYAVEYRLDAGAWQDSPVFTGLAAATYNLQVRFKLYTYCGDNRNIVVGATACDIQLQAIEVTHEQGRFSNDGTITIYGATDDGPLEYSIDDGVSYQSGNVFEGLSPDTYQVRIKNAVAGCEAAGTTVINRFKEPYLEFSQANAHRVVIQSGPMADTGKQNQDNTLFADMRHVGVSIGCYAQKVKDRVSTIQFRTSYSTNTVKLYNAANVLQETLTPVKRNQYIGKTDTRNATFCDAGANQVQVWFEGGLPNFFKVGQPIEVTGNADVNGNYIIQDIMPGTFEAEGNIVLIIDKTWTAITDIVTASVTTIYDVELFDVWEISLDWLGRTAGKYYLVFEGSDQQFDAYTAKSEPIEVISDDTGLVELHYYNHDNAFKIDYNTGIEFYLLVEADLLPDAPGGEREIMEDSRRRTVLLREFVTRNLLLSVYDVPPYLAEKVALALAHDVKKADGVQVEKADDVTIEKPEQTDLHVDLTCKLRQVEFMSENEDDSGDVDANALEVGDGNIMQVVP